jgi:hypothetical protein
VVERFFFVIFITFKFFVLLLKIKNRSLNFSRKKNKFHSSAWRDAHVNLWSVVCVYGGMLFFPAA